MQRSDQRLYMLLVLVLGRLASERSWHQSFRPGVLCRLDRRGGLIGGLLLLSHPARACCRRLAGGGGALVGCTNAEVIARARLFARHPGRPTVLGAQGGGGAGLTRGLRMQRDKRLDTLGGSSRIRDRNWCGLGIPPFFNLLILTAADIDR
jgi:hypothetical protein